jgi:hypothetical protein
LALPSLPFSLWLYFYPTITVLIPQKGPQQGKGWLFAHWWSGLSEVSLDYK